MKIYTHSILLTIAIFFSFVGKVSAQQPLTDRIVIEFMKPGDKDAEARSYNLVPWPEEAKAAAYKAAEIWASYLEITVPVRVKMGWCDNLDADARGGARFNYQYTDKYYYPLPLINQLVGFDKNTDVVDIICVFKSNLDIGWYFGTDGGIGITPDPNDPNAAYFQKDFLTIALHEMSHGLGLTSSMIINENKGTWGGAISKAYIFDTFLCDNNDNQLIDENHYKNNSVSLGSVLTSEQVYWKGVKAAENNAGNRVKMHAPKKWSLASIDHIDKIYAKTENNLMAGVGIGGGNHQHAPGPIILGMLQDMGWTVKNTSTASEVIENNSLAKVYATAGVISVSNVNIGDLISVYQLSGKIIYNGKITSDKMEIAVAGTGIYIVRVGKDSFKVIL